MSQIPIELTALLQGSGITLIVGYLGIKELMNIIRKRNGRDDRNKWRDIVDSHEKRLSSIETKQNSMDGKLDLIISKLISKN